MTKMFLLSLVMVAACVDEPVEPTATFEDELVTDVMYWFEGEAATLAFPMARLSSATASTGGYIAVPPNRGPGGSARLTFSTSIASDHLAGWIRVMAPAAGANWMTVSFDGHASHFELLQIASWEWVRIPNTSWSATTGSHAIVITSDVPDVRVDRVLLTSNNIFEPAVLTIEAEGGGLLAPMQIGGGFPTLSPRYVHAPVGSPPGGLDRMSTPVTQDGSRFVWGLVSTASSSTSSFWVSTNAGAKTAWTLPVTSGAWAWARAPIKLDYPRLDNFTDIEPIDDGAKLDKLLVTNDPGFVPVVQSLENAPN